MISLKILRNDLDWLAKKLSERSFKLDIKYIKFIENERKNLQIKTELLQSNRNKISKLIGQKKILGENLKILFEKAKKISLNLESYQDKLRFLKKQINNFVQTIPNIPDDKLPNKNKYKNGKEVGRWGCIPKYDFKIKDHIELGIKNNGLDWSTAAKISGSRFVLMKGKTALLHRALGQFMLDIHTNKNGYLEVYVPYLSNYSSMYSTGQLPKFENDLFHIKKNDNIFNKYSLIPTSEVPLTNLVSGQILEDKILPLKFTAHTPCFRAENLSYGTDSKGLIRLHQFDKVEIVQIVKPENSMKALEEVTSHAEMILRLLNLPYRKILLTAENMSFASTKTYDLEVWFPSQNKYREISSCSNMSDFQSRRMKSKFRCKKSQKIDFVHTLNGSGLALGRTLAAIMENNQEKDGRIKVPKILIEKYMHGIKYID
ncbi:Serine--tRNA ligase [Buchnera aphidicola (Neophyllaphis podocarpi)]|uniref:serine--tRNA ligase n=1 Tax=Buchnera aphidicola TaxID=9 RepID=UPI003464C09D